MLCGHNSAVSLVTKPKTDAEFHNLVYGVTEIPPKEPRRGITVRARWRCVVIAMLVAVNNFLVERKEKINGRPPNRISFRTAGPILLVYGS